MEDLNRILKDACLFLPKPDQQHYFKDWMYAIGISENKIMSTDGRLMYISSRGVSKDILENNFKTYSQQGYVLLKPTGKPKKSANKCTFKKGKIYAALTNWEEFKEPPQKDTNFHGKPVCCITNKYELLLKIKIVLLCP